MNVCAGYAISCEGIAYCQFLSKSCIHLFYIKEQILSSKNKQEQNYKTFSWSPKNYCVICLGQGLELNQLIWQMLLQIVDICDKS